MNVWVAGVAVVLAAAGVGKAAVEGQVVEGRFERTLAIVDGTELDVRTTSGRIEVRAGKSGEARIRALVRGYADRWTPDGSDVVKERVRAIAAKPPVGVSGGVLRVGYRRGEARQVGVSYRVVVPVDTKVRLHTGSGTVVVGGIRGPLEVRNGAGATTVANIAGDVTVAANSGRVELRRVAGEVDARTGAGAISIGRPGRAVRAHTGSGRIEVEGAPEGTWELTAGSGDIQVAMPGDAAFEVDAHTRVGTVSANHEIDVEARATGQLYGIAGEGGPRVVLRTGSGDIVVDVD